MVIISSNIQSQIQTLIEQYVNYRTKGEYGINAFWYWYYQVMSYLRNMDSIRLRVGFNLKYRMPKWGTVGYTKIVVGKDVIVYADTFIYSKRNLYNWLNHKSNRNPSYSVCDNCFGFKNILYDNSQKYAILKPDGKRLVKPVFDDIINFHHSSNDYNTLHAIGFINDRVYEISTDGNIVLLHMSKEDYLNAEHKFFEARQRQKIIEYKQYNTMNNTRNRVRLTESQLRSVIKESVKQVLSELDWKTYQNAAKKSHLKALDNDDMSDNEYHNELDKSRRFRQAAEDAFNRDYGTNDTKLHSYMHGSKKQAPGGGYFPFHDDSYIEMKKDSDTYGTYYPYGYNKDFEWSYGYDSSKYRPEWDRAKQELKHYQNGDFDYDDEKGWHLKDNMDESIRRAIRKVLH